MKIAILGCGSLGSTFGGVLTEAGHDVVLVNPLTKHHQAMMSHGLTLIEDGNERQVKVNAVVEPTEAGLVDLIIVLVKSSFTREAITGAQAMIGKNTFAMSLQNGLGNEEILAESLGEGRVLSGKTYVGGVMVTPGQVQIGVQGKKTFIGELDGRISERAQAVCDMFNRAGLLTEVLDDIKTLIWEKLLVNVSTGAICGITRLTYGQLPQVPEAVNCALTAVEEAILVGLAAGARLEGHNPQEVLNNAMADLPYDFKTSILQDIEKHMPTEVDFINGAIVRVGRKYGISTPVNSALVAAIKGIEFKNKQAGGDQS
jgi:2-dehydropantoate 2-reductase